MNSSTTDATDPTARLSVVIASSNNAALLVECVGALASDGCGARVEVIVVRAVDRDAGTARSTVTVMAPDLRWIDAPAGSTVPRLRGLGMSAARGESIALLEDDCVADSTWCREALLLPPAGVAAVGGAVEPAAYRRHLDWAVYFCEYGRFMRPVPETPDAPLPGNNVVYSRRALDGLPESARREFHDAFVHAGWQASGVPTQVSSTLVVRNINRWSLTHVTTSPFHHGRAYAARRFGTRPPIARATIAFLALGLPVVKAARVVRDVLRRRRFRGRMIGALPWILIFVASWSAGEAVGCVAGPGASPARWR